MKKIYLKKVFPWEIKKYRDKWQGCLVGDAELSETDTIILAYEVGTMYEWIRDIAIFIYEENGDTISDFCIVRLEDKTSFMLAFRKMIRYFRGRYTKATTYVEKTSHMVAWCDKLYERVGEDEDSYEYNIMKTIKRRERDG